jgi:pyrroline-5-carboxylate reductase
MSQGPTFTTPKWLNGGGDTAETVVRTTIPSGPVLPAPAWFIGCGNMGGAMIAGWRAAGIDMSQAVVIRPSGGAVEGVRTVANLGEAGTPPKLVVLAVKPQKLDEVAGELEPLLTGDVVLVSILAGVEVASLRQRFPNAAAIVRAMPNLPVEIRRGVVALYSEDANDAVRQQLGDLFVALGWAMWTADEERLAAIGSVAGAGPAYVARFVRALARAGEARGLTREIASTIALETVLGTAWMAATSGESTDSVVKRVASPSGTTEAGLAILDKALDELIEVTIDAAGRRGAQLAADARVEST